MMYWLINSPGLTVCIFLALLSSLNQTSPFELIHMTDETRTELTGAITLKCRDDTTAEELDIAQNSIHFWLNRTSLSDPDLREREDFGVIKIVGCCSIQFDLTRQIDGDFTCGKLFNDGSLQESTPKRLICKWYTV